MKLEVKFKAPPFTGIKEAVVLRSRYNTARIQYSRSQDTELQ